jgi:hypothetical protein
VYSASGRVSGDSTVSPTPEDNELHKSRSHDPLSPSPSNLKLPTFSKSPKPKAPPLKKSNSNPPMTMNGGLSSPPLPISPGQQATLSFAENAKKRRSATGMKQIEQFTLGMINAPIKLAGKAIGHGLTPDGSKMSGEFPDYFGASGGYEKQKVKETEEEREKREWEKEKKRRRKIKEKKRQEEIFVGDPSLISLAVSPFGR